MKRHVLRLASAHAAGTNDLLESKENHLSPPHQSARTNRVSRPRLTISLNWEDQGNGSYYARDDATGLSAQVMKSGLEYFWFIADLPSIPCCTDEGYLNFEGRAATAEEAMTAAENAIPAEEEYRAMLAKAESLLGEWH
jgi:hypothetical protein